MSIVALKLFCFHGMRLSVNTSKFYTAIVNPQTCILSTESYEWLWFLLKYNSKPLKIVFLHLKRNMSVGNRKKCLLGLNLPLLKTLLVTNHSRASFHWNASQTTCSQILITTMAVTMMVPITLNLPYLLHSLLLAIWSPTAEEPTSLDGLKQV